MRFFISLFVVALLAATQASAEPEAIKLSDLADPAAMSFDDPYKDMGLEMLDELRLLVRLQQKLSDENLSQEEGARLEARRLGAQEKLAANGQDINTLLSQRWEVARKRRAALIATNPIFDGAEVTISGFLISGPQAADGSRFGYLVPQVGMCSHLPPPPPNRLVRISLRADQQVESPYVPIRVSGLLRAEPSDTTIFIHDGESRMLSGWMLDAKTIDFPES